MTVPDNVPVRTRDHVESLGQRDSFGPMRHGLAGASDSVRIAELERENNRLQLLVAELLIKNQQLRRPD